MGDMLPVTIRRMIEAVASASGLSPGTIARKAYGSGDFYKRLRLGCDITSRRAVDVLRWLSDHWPESAKWPADIPRPAPAAPETERPITQTAAPLSDPVVAARAAWARMVDATDPESRRAAAAEAFAAGARLNAAGRIASPAALCAALGCGRKVYDNTVRRYAHGRRNRPPRPGSATARMVAALREAGDVRFAPSPSPQEAAC